MDRFGLVADGADGRKEHDCCYEIEGERERESSGEDGSWMARTIFAKANNTNVQPMLVKVEVNYNINNSLHKCLV